MKRMCHSEVSFSFTHEESNGKTCSIASYNKRDSSREQRARDVRMTIFNYLRIEIQFREYPC